MNEQLVQQCLLSGFSGLCVGSSSAVSSIALSLFSSLGFGVCFGSPTGVSKVAGVASAIRNNYLIGWNYRIKICVKPTNNYVPLTYISRSSSAGSFWPILDMELSQFHNIILFNCFQIFSLSMKFGNIWVEISHDDLLQILKKK
jgi:hypothetical protein